MIKTEIPLFPLNTVLFPGAHLPLRIFEQRYIDMVRECSASDSCFGVCLVNEAMHQDQHASHRQTGTTAEICDWFTTSDGLLGIIARGRQKFSVSKTGRCCWMITGWSNNVSAQHEGWKRSSREASITWWRSGCRCGPIPVSLDFPTAGVQPSDDRPSWHPANAPVESQDSSCLVLP